MSEFKGKMYSISSSNIQQIGWEYCEETKQGVLRVVFKNQRTYDYFPVEKKKYDEFWKADKKGSWFHTEIKSSPLISFEEVQ